MHVGIISFSFAAFKLKIEKKTDCFFYKQILLPKTRSHMCPRLQHKVNSTLFALQYHPKTRSYFSQDTIQFYFICIFVIFFYFY